MATTATHNIILTDEAITESHDQGIDIHDGFKQIVDFFAEVDLRNNPTFEIETVQDIATGERATKYEGLIVGRFTKQIGSDMVLHVCLANGDVFPMILVRG